ncbi:MAG: serine/threonine-protein kinase [Desulfobacterales bacterium]|jgi:serine/threonine-protein kinase
MELASVHSQFINGLVNAKSLGRYKILKKIGQGGSGVVYLARDSFIQRLVAVKISQSGSKISRKRMFLEAQSAGRLNHPNILAIYDTGLYNKFCYIIMEYIEGGTLKALCKARQQLPPARCAEIIFNVCSAIDYAHKQGVIHRDIKPSNIMIDSSGTPKIMDFGIAQMTERTSEKGLWGTPSYMSPEQLREETVVAQSDIFSLGCVLYELLTGVRAFGGDNDFSVIYKITREEPKPVRQIRPEIPEIFDGILRKAMAKRPGDRYQTGIAFAYDLKVALRGLRQTPLDRKIDDVVDLVRTVPFFNEFSREQIKSLGLTGNVIRMRKGKIIVEEGDIDDTFFIILSGKVKIHKDRKKIAVVGSGECFGEMAYIAGQSRSASATAYTDCILMKISATLLDKAPESIQLLFFKNFARTLSQRLERSSAARDG